MANQIAATKPASPARFIFGLVGFVALAALLEKYDDSHGTQLLIGYTVIVLLGIALYQRDALTAGLTDLQSAVSSAPAAKTPALTQAAALAKDRP